MQVTHFITLRTAAAFALLLSPFVVSYSKNPQGSVIISSLLVLLQSKPHPKKDYARISHGLPIIRSLATTSDPTRTIPFDMKPGPPRGLSTAAGTIDREKNR